MSRRPGRTRSAAFRAKVALAAARDDKTLAELAQQYDVQLNQITDWKNQLLTQAVHVFGGEPSAAEPAIVCRSWTSRRSGASTGPSRQPRSASLLQSRYR